MGHWSFTIALLLCIVLDFQSTFGLQSVSSSGDFAQLAHRACHTIVCSDQKRDTTGFDGASTGWTSWVDEKSASQLQETIDRVELLPHEWTRWMRDCPVPAMLDLTAQLRSAVQNCLQESQTVEDITPRLGLRLIYLPSGQALQQPLQTAPGGMIYGKLLKGGVTRCRLIGEKRRRAGERTVIANDPERSWLQYGGPERSYEALDVGECVLLELILLPAGLELPLLNETATSEMFLSSIPWDPKEMMCLEDRSTLENSDGAFDSQQNVQESESTSNFESSVGGLGEQIDEIVRRVLEFRGLKNEHKDEVKTLIDLGLHPVRGLLLYGPPGCGKTKLAREMAKLLGTRQPPKIVAAPELLDRWVGGTEDLVRELFADAEAELRQKSAMDSSLHVVVVDEIDAVFRKRSDSDSASEVTRASAVNQILSKLDGMHAMDNVLFIGMTNRRELLDPALLRPGRLEVQIEIPQPTREGRREILKIHFDALRKRGRLSQPLCNAIDGVKSGSSITTRLRLPFDLAADRWTGGFSGADIAGLVRSAGSIALSRCRKQGDGGISSLVVTLPDVAQALKELKT